MPSRLSASDKHHSTNTGAASLKRRLPRCCCGYAALCRYAPDEAVQQPCAVEYHDRAADFVYDAEQLFPEALAQQRHDDRQRREPEHGGRGEAEDKRRCAARRKRGAERADQERAVDDGLRVDPCDDKGRSREPTPSSRRRCGSLSATDLSQGRNILRCLCAWNTGRRRPRCGFSPSSTRSTAGARSGCAPMDIDGCAIINNCEEVIAGRHK